MVANMVATLSFVLYQDINYRYQIQADINDIA